MSTVSERFHVVKLRDEAVLVLDRENDMYRLVLYRRRKNTDKGGRLTEAYFDDLVRREILPRGYHTSWFRVSARHVNLGIGLAHLIEAAKTTHDPYEIQTFIRSTGWGKDLP